MKKLLAIGCLLVSSLAFAEHTKGKFNYCTGCSDFITALDTTSIQAGAGIFVTTTTDGVTITGTGSGPTGQINPAARYSSPYYSTTGSSNVISGLSPGTSGQILTTQGSAGPPFWSNNIPPGSTNYIQNSSSVQSGAILNISSGTISTLLVSGISSGQCIQTGAGGLLTGTGVSCGTGSGGGASGQVNSSAQNNIPFYSISGSSNVLSGDNALTWNNSTYAQLGIGNPSAMFFGGYNLAINPPIGSAGNGMVGIQNNSNIFSSGIDFITYNGDDNEILVYPSGKMQIATARSTQTITLSVGSSPTIVIESTGTVFTGFVSVSSSILLSNSAGTNGQVLTSGGSGASPSWVTVSGTGDAVLRATQTWTGQNNWITTSQSTFTYGVSVGSLTVNGTGAGEIDLVEGSAPSGTSSNSVLWADSTSLWPEFNPHNTVPYLMVGSSATTTAGHCVQFSANGSVIDAGSACGTGSGGASSLAVYVNGVQTSSPTSSVSFNGPGVSYNNSGSSTTVIITGSGSGGSLTGFYIKDSSNQIWVVTVDTSSHLVTSTTGSVPSGSLYRTSYVLQDSSLNYWTVTIDTSGHLVTASGGSSASAIQDLIVDDSTNYSWIVTVNTSGYLVTS